MFTGSVAWLFRHGASQNKVRACTRGSQCEEITWSIPDLKYHWHETSVWTRGQSETGKAVNWITGWWFIFCLEVHGAPLESGEAHRRATEELITPERVSHKAVSGYLSALQEFEALPFLDPGWSVASYSRLAEVLPCRVEAGLTALNDSVVCLMLSEWWKKCIYIWCTPTFTSISFGFVCRCGKGR